MTSRSSRRSHIPVHCFVLLPGVVGSWKACVNVKPTNQRDSSISLFSSTVKALQGKLPIAKHAAPEALSHTVCPGQICTGQICSTHSCDRGMTHNAQRYHYSSHKGACDSSCISHNRLTQPIPSQTGFESSWCYTPNNYCSCCTEQVHSPPPSRSVMIAHSAPKLSL